MSKVQKSQAEDPEVAIEHALNTTEAFIEKHGKKMLIALGVVVLCVGGYFGYKHLYMAPRVEKAAAAMATAQNVFAAGDFADALKGTTSYAGFEEIAMAYSSLPQGNIANHYAGICCLNTGDYEGAIKFFDKFSTVGGAVGEIISANNLGLTGDAYVELNDMQKGLSFYEKAAAYSKNADTTPTYLKKAALVNESLGNYAKAIEQYRTIKFDYPASFLARDIDKYIALAEQKL